MAKAKYIVYKCEQVYSISTTTKTVEIPEFKIDNNNIEVVDNFLFLGLNINKNLNWKNHFNCIGIKISRTIGLMRRLRHVIPFDFWLCFIIL